MAEPNIDDLAEDDPRRFLLATEPIVDVTRRLADAIRELIGRYSGIPESASPAMAELAQESTWPNVPEWDKPVGTAHSTGISAMVASTENLRCYGRLFTDLPAPLYGHLVLARSVIETSVLTAWLMEQRIGARERVKRSLIEWMRQARAQERVPALRVDARERYQLLRRVASEFGWSVSNRKDWLEVDGVAPPSTKAALHKLLPGDPEALGPVIYNWLSGAVHGDLSTWFLDADVGEEGAGPGGATFVTVGVTSKSVALATVPMLAACLAALDNFLVVMGWPVDAKLAQARTDAEALIAGLRRAHGWA
jgi:hypothetical protein